MPNNLFCLISHHRLMSFQRQCPKNTSSTTCVNDGFSWLLQQETCFRLIIRLNCNVSRTFLRKLFNFQKELVQCLCLTPCREVISRHQHLHLQHWFLLETFWAVFAEVSSETTAEASRPSANLLNIWRWRLRIGILSRLLPSDQSSYCLFFIDMTPRSCCSASRSSSLSPESTSDVDCSSRGIRGSSQSSMT